MKKAASTHLTQLEAQLYGWLQVAGAPEKNNKKVAFPVQGWLLKEQKFFMCSSVYKKSP